jgi:flagellar biogenesis protein FliO
MLANAIRNSRIPQTWMTRVFQYCRSQLRRRPVRKLRLCESLTLGEKRFLAVVQFEHLRYLVAGTGSSLTLLSQLPDGTPEPHILGKSPEGETCDL